MTSLYFRALLTPIPTPSCHLFYASFISIIGHADPPPPHDSPNMDHRPTLARDIVSFIIANFFYK